MTHILETHPEVLWGFFFGLILASVWFIGKDVDRRSVVNFLVFLAGTVLALVITWMYPLSASRSLPYVFLCGMVAICALILPGISGSFILLLLGMYTVVIPTVKDFILHQRMEDFLLVAVFAAGCLVGLLSFSRVMSWLFRYYQMPTLAMLTGFMLGSLPRIWPWRNPILWVDDAGLITTVFPLTAEDPHVLRETLVLPSGYQGTSNVVWVVLAFALGIAIVLMLSRIPEREVKLSGQD